MVLASTGVHEVERAPQNGCRQCLCHQGELRLPPASPGDSPRSAGGSDPDSIQLTASALRPGACEILCVPFKNGVYFPQPSGLPKVNPISLQQMFWGLIFPAQDSWAGHPDVGHLTPWGGPVQL